MSRCRGADRRPSSRGGSSRAERGGSPGAARRRSSSRRRGSRRRGRGGSRPRGSGPSAAARRRPPSFRTWAVTSWSWPSTAMRPRTPGGRRSRRVVARSVPPKRSRTLAALPSGSSQSSRARVSASGGGSASPRRTSLNARLAPGSTRNAGSARHSSGRSVREGSIGVEPEISTCRWVSSAAKTHTSRGGQGSLGGSFGRPIVVRTAVDARLDAHGVAAAAHLHAQGVLLDARRQVARDGHGNRARQERSRRA